ncbi:MAG: tetratricopeptide repeat protein [Xanthomonadaceae bacterium]|nr:tetratricopeptide repeat protein [Xanthomonadaceae bacterium]
MLIALFSASLAIASSVLEVETLKTHSRVRLKIDETIPAKVIVNKKGFEITVPGLAPDDLGLLEGAIKASDQRFAGLTVASTKDSTRISAHWKQENMETFDYRQKNPPSLVLDFWSKGGLTATQLQKLVKSKKKKNKWSKAQAGVSSLIQEIQRREARRKEVIDPNRFCRGTREDETEIFLTFKPAHETIDFTKWMSITTPDRDYPYLKPEGNTEEEKTVNLAHELFERGKHALVLKAIEFFQKDYPQSKYLEDILFLKANTKLKLGLTAEADREFQDIILRAPKSSPAYFSGFMQAVKAFSKDEYLQSLEKFMWLVEHYPDHPSNWVFHLGVAESLYAIKETVKAEQEYEWIEKNAPDLRIRSEAAFRVGDLYMNREQYAEALTAYTRAMRKYPEYTKHAPIVFINRAESLYWLGEYKQAATEFESYLKNQASHPMGWRASFRLGELADRSQDPKVRELGRKWYQKTINDYPVSAGAALSRARLMVCGDHGGFSYELAEVFFHDQSQIRRIVNESASDEVQDFISLARARTYQSLAPSELTLQAIEDELKKQIKSKTRDELKALLLVALRTEVGKLLDANKGYQALQIYKSYRDLLPFKTDPDLVDFMLKLAQSAISLELPTVAQMVLGDYRERWGTRAEPTPEMAMKRSDEYYTEAQLIWDAEGLESEAKTREALDKIPEISEYYYQKTVLLGQIEEKKANFSQAIIYISKALVLSSGKKEQPILQYWAAKTLAKLERYGAAAKAYSDVRFTEEPIVFMGLEDFPDEERLIELAAENYEKDKNWGKAAEYYEKLAAAQEKPTNRTLYQLAMNVEKTDPKTTKVKVSQLLKKVSISETNDFWKTLALEALQNRTKEGTGNGN